MPKTASTPMLALLFAAAALFGLRTDALAQTPAAEAEPPTATEAQAADSAPAEPTPVEEAPVDEPMADEPKADEAPAPQNPPTPESSADPSAEPSPEAAPAANPANDDPLALGRIDPDNPGHKALDRALERKLEAKDLKDLNETIELLDEALEAGLDAGNTDFAEELLVATLLQRSSSLAGAVLGKPVANPTSDPRWLQIRQFALTDLQRAVGIDPDQRDAWLLIGRLQSLPLGSPAEARRALTKYLRLAEQPSDDTPETDAVAQAYALRAAAQKEDKDRMADLQKAIDLLPTKEEYLLLRAQAHREAGRPDEALADLDRAVEMAPENARVHEMRALALMMQNRAEDALESLNRATEIDPQLLSPYLYRGGVYGQLGRLDEAIEQLDKALEISPSNAQTLMTRARLYVASEQYEKALEDLEGVLRQQPLFSEAVLMRVQLLRMVERDEDAIRYLEGLLAANQDRADLRLQLASIYADRKMPAEAIEALNRVLQIDEDNELALRLRADMYLFVGRHEEAIDEFNRTLETAPDDTQVLNNYAWTLATSPFDGIRDGARAVELAEKAAELTEFNAPHILSTLAAAHAEAGDFDQAVRFAEQAVTKAQEMELLDQYDGQLEAEVQAYKDKQPWRELQGRDFSGPANQAAEALGDLKASGAEPAPGKAAPTAGEQADNPGASPPETGATPAIDPPVRSFDF